MRPEPRFGSAATTVLLVIALTVPVARGAPAAGPDWTDPVAVSGALQAYLEDVKGAAGRRYAERDDRGHELDGLAILSAPDGGFVGVSHWWSAPPGEFRIGLSTSNDLLTDDERRSIHQPVRFIWGADDAFGAVDIARAFSAAVPDARLEVVPGAGHSPWMDDAELAAELTRRALVD